VELTELAPSWRNAVTAAGGKCTVIRTLLG
jgi:hypothetical protein